MPPGVSLADTPQELEDDRSGYLVGPRRRGGARMGGGGFAILGDTFLGVLFRRRGSYYLGVYSRGPLFWETPWEVRVA